MKDIVDSDVPQIVRPKAGHRGLIMALIACALIIAGVLSIPFFQSWQEDQANEAKRGPYMGAVYEIAIDGQPHQMELGWGDRNLLVNITPALPQGATVRVSGRLGDETLTLNPKAPVYGPTTARVSPYAHHRIHIVIESQGKVLWSGTQWAWGVPAHEHAH